MEHEVACIFKIIVKVRICGAIYEPDCKKTERNAKIKIVLLKF